MLHAEPRVVRFFEISALRRDPVNIAVIRLRLSSMQSQAVQLLGFPNDDALHDVLTKFNILTDYKAFLPDHLVGVLREQHPDVQIRSIEFLSAGECNLGGFPSPDNSEHLLVDSLTAPLDLRLRLSTNGSDLHELEITLEINATNVRESPQITTDMLVRNHDVIG